ncbi:MAG: KH domain-containing protein [Clostridia bacterium]|nr:KH domain-containing protein [Clostridia bacterium]
MKELEITAKNVEMAIAQGLAQLGLEREDVNIRIVSAGGMFKKAKVVLEYEEKINEVVHNITENVDNVVEETTEIEPAQNEIVAEENVVEKPKKETKKARSLEANPALEEALTEYIEGLCKVVGTTYELSYEYTAQGIMLRLNGSSMGKLIGYRGEGMNSLQHIMNSLPVVKENNQHVILDIEGYREKRKEALERMAKRTADKAIANHKNIALEPMNAYERRIVHEIVANMQGVTTESVGEGKYRHIVFKVK